MTPRTGLTHLEAWEIMLAGGYVRKEWWRDGDEITVNAAGVTVDRMGFRVSAPDDGKANWVEVEQP